eukprot:635642-Pyramimonas_sp.AAC.2
MEVSGRSWGPHESPESVLDRYQRFLERSGTAAAPGASPPNHGISEVPDVFRSEFVPIFVFFLTEEEEE